MARATSIPLKNYNNKRKTNDYKSFHKEITITYNFKQVDQLNRKKERSELSQSSLQYVPFS